MGSRKLYEASIRAVLVACYSFIGFCFSPELYAAPPDVYMECMGTLTITPIVKRVDEDTSQTACFELSDSTPKILHTQLMKISSGTHMENVDTFDAFQYGDARDTCKTQAGVFICSSGDSTDPCAAFSETGIDIYQFKFTHTARVLNGSYATENSEWDHFLRNFSGECEVLEKTSWKLRRYR